MKLYAYYSSALLPLWEIFSKSVQEQTSFTFLPLSIPAEFDGAKYGEDKYFWLMRWIGLDRLRLLKENLGDTLVFSGCDMEFFGDACLDLEQRFTGADYLMPRNDPGNDTGCGCLQALRANEATVKLYGKVYAGAGRVPDDPLLDQHRGMAAWRLLPREKYWNLGGSLWQAGKPVPQPPKEILWFHANWTIGLANKLFLLNEVKRLHEEGKQ